MRHAVAALFAAVLTLALAPLAQADPSEYGIASAGAVPSTNQAGAHPDFTVSFELNTEPSGQLPATTRELTFDLPPGVLANPSAVPKCSTAQLAATDVEDEANHEGCPQDSQVGIANIRLFRGGGGSLLSLTEPIYNMRSPGGDTVARLGFIGLVYPIFVNAHLRPQDGYGATAAVQGASSFVPLLSSDTTLWGVPAAPSHDTRRITPFEASHCNGSPCTAPEGKRPSGVVPAPYTLNPTRCATPLALKVTAVSYALPDSPSILDVPMAPISGCGALEFKPSISFAPTTQAADSPAGMDVEISLPQQGLISPNVLSEAHLKRTVVTLPAGLDLNPAAAGGLASCSEAQIGLVSESPIRFDASDPTCPSASKVGTAEIQTPLLEEPVDGALYLARQDDNPFHALLAGYLVARGQGVTIKLAGRFDINPTSGQITTFFDENPQAPFERATLHFKGGDRGVLITPPACGSYSIHSELSPWSAADPFNPTAAETVPSDSPFAIDSVPNGGACPGGGFAPRLSAWSTRPQAGAYSPFVLGLSREDGEQRFATTSFTLPAGLVAKLAGVPRCSEGEIAAAAARSGIGQGAAELLDSSCPAKGALGRVVAGTGAGLPFYLDTGRAYLAPPYKGAPLSLVVVTPAVTGPFDLGAVVVRIALYVDPRSARVTAVSDPLPTALAGIPIDLRDVRALIDRSQFTLNPTNCSVLRIQSEVTSTRGAVARPSERFQVNGCRALGFTPSLALHLRGRTNRGAHPALRAVLRPRSGDTNIAGAQVALPHSEFLDQAHIRTVCTRVQFAAGNCPAGSVYGHARATTPLFDGMLEGPIYLRSSSHPLPDLVVALRGPPSEPIEVDAVGRVDSIDGGIRTTFENTPDAPVSKLVLSMQGGKKGLLVNSRNLCASASRAKAVFSGQNGVRTTLRPLLQNACAKSGRKASRRHARAHKG